MPEVLRPGRYPINALVLNDASQPPRRYYDSYAYHVELHDPVTVPAGYKGVITNLSGPMPQNPNVLLVFNAGLAEIMSQLIGAAVQVTVRQTHAATYDRKRTR